MGRMNGWRARRNTTERWVLGVVSLGVSCAGVPQRGDTGMRAFGFDLWDVHCPSGLRVVVERAPGSRVAGGSTVVRTGSSDDPPGHEGLAHPVAHLTFRAHPEGQDTPTHRLGALRRTRGGRARL